MLYDNPGRGSILFTPNTVRMFETSMQTTYDQPESGGYLFGQLFGDQLVINVATPPGPDDIREPRFIKRIKHRGQLLLNRIWTKSNRRIILAGEWHTHFEVEPKPSIVDYEESNKALRKNITHLDFMVVVIVSSRAVVNSWVGVRESNGLVRAERIGYKLWSDGVKETEISRNSSSR